VNPPGVTFKGNARNDASGDGPLKLNLPVVAYTFANATDPNGADFLRYPRAAPLALQPGGPVGVPPQE
jgi:hypothetical protein